MPLILHTLSGADLDRPFSPHCWKVVMALRHKGLEFEERPSAFTAIPQLEGGFSKTVPILNDNGHLVKDSFAIALYLEEVYPDRPSLFGGEGGKALSRLVEGYSQTIVHPGVTMIAVKDIHDMLAEKDQVYFRSSREAYLGKTLEDLHANRASQIAAFPARLDPMRHMLKVQPFIGGDSPLFADYILFGALQWARLTAGDGLLAADDPVLRWFERCLDLFDAQARSVTAA